MRILLIHNFYQSHAPSGEDAVFKNEVKLLCDRGHEIITYVRYNDDLKGMNSFAKSTSTLSGIFWSPRAYFDLKKIISNFRPDIAHIHNLFYLLSPSVYDALRSEKIPIVHTLHNYRIFCPGALLLRDGKICEECLTKGPLRGIKYGCFRNSVNTFPLALSLAFHKRLNTWNHKVNVFIALTEFSKKVYARGGLTVDKIIVKPNFLSNPPEPNFHVGTYAVFIGRVSSEKGVYTLLQAWKEIDFPLKILGDGPLLHDLQKKANAKRLNIEFMGQRPFKDVINILKNALFLVLSSNCYEGFPMVITEAFASGKPVLASNLGAMKTIVDDGSTGYLFEPGNSHDLAKKAKMLIDNPQHTIELGKNARKEFDDKYSESVNYKTLMNIYRQAIDDNTKEAEKKK